MGPRNLTVGMRFGNEKATYREKVDAFQFILVSNVYICSENQQKQNQNQNQKFNVLKIEQLVS